MTFTKQPFRKCIVADCEKKAVKKEYCGMHKQRLIRHGDINYDGIKHDYLVNCFDKQRNFIEDPAKLKAAFCARRSAKSYTIGIYSISECMKKADTKVLYFGKTEDAAVNVMWLHTIREICDRLNIVPKYVKSEQTIYFKNKSSIKLTGGDASDDAIDKALGGKYSLCIFDECQVFNHDLETFVRWKLGPAMVDSGGTICLLGTAGNLMGDRYWYKITRQEGVREPGWSVHEWSPLDNPYMAEKVKAEWKRLKEQNPDIEQDPNYQQQWMNKWTIDTDSRIYKYSSIKNALTDQTTLTSIYNQDPKWKFIIGIDFGFEDDTALTVGANNQYDPNFYIVESWKQPHMLTEDIALKIKEYRNKYRPIHIVGDCQNKTLIETLRIQYSIPIVPADKPGKVAHIAAMNSDLILSKIKVIESQCLPLIKEWNELTWNTKKRLLGTFEELASKANHAADSALYLHHFSKHYRAIPEPVEIVSSFQKKAIEKYNRSNNYTSNEIINNDSLMESYIKGY